MSYKDWRKQFESDDQAARRGYEQSFEIAHEFNLLQRDKISHDVAYEGMRAQRDAYRQCLRDCLSWIESDTEDLLRDLLHGTIGYPEMYASIEKLRIMMERALYPDAEDGQRTKDKEPGG
jgi:hypothetical protein